MEFALEKLALALTEYDVHRLFDELGIRVSKEKRNQFAKVITDKFKKVIDGMKHECDCMINSVQAKEQAKREELFKGNKFLEEMIARTVSEKLKVNVSTGNTTVAVKLDWDGKQISEASDELGLEDYVRRPNPMDE